MQGLLASGSKKCLDDDAGYSGKQPLCILLQYLETLAVTIVSHQEIVLYEFVWSLISCRTSL